MQRHAVLAILALGLSLGACATDAGGRRIPARFACEDGSRLDLVFDHEKNAAVLRLPKGATAVLPWQKPDAGLWYSGQGYDLRGAGDEVTFTAPGQPATRCTQVR